MSKIADTIIADAEGIRKQAYIDPGSYLVPTIGYGIALVVKGHDGWQARPIGELTEITSRGEMNMTPEQVKSMHDNLSTIADYIDELETMNKIKKLVVSGKDRKTFTKEEKKLENDAYIIQQKYNKILASQKQKTGLNPVIGLIKQSIKSAMYNYDKDGNPMLNSTFDFAMSDKGALQTATDYLIYNISTMTPKIERVAKKNKTEYKFNPDKDFKNPLFSALISHVYQKGNSLDTKLLLHYAKDNAGEFVHHLLCNLKTTTPGRSVREFVSSLDYDMLSNKQILSIKKVFTNKKESLIQGFNKLARYAKIIGIKDFSLAKYSKDIEKTAKNRGINDTAPITVASIIGNKSK